MTPAKAAEAIRTGRVDVYVKRVTARTGRRWVARYSDQVQVEVRGDRAVFTPRTSTGGTA